MRTQSVFVRFAPVTAAALVALAGVVIAGPLSPSAGPIAPSFKTLSEVEPRIALSPANTPGDAQSVYRITQPGSYYLTENLTVNGDMTAIEVVVSDVTIDLAGFIVSRPNAGSGTRSLIQYGPNFPRNIVVRNGTVRNAAKHGIELGTESRVEDVRVISSGSNGIMLNGARAAAYRCMVATAGGNGIQVSVDALVVDCVVNGALGNGIEASTNCEVRSCNVDNASGNGVFVAFGTVVRGCVVRSCIQFGISSSLNSGTALITDNQVLLNTLGGIRIYGGSIVTGNNVSMSGTTTPCILVSGDGNRIERNLLHFGNDAVRIEAAGEDNLVTGNHSRGAGNGNGFANVNAGTNMIGPVITAAGTISSTSPYANFSR